MSEAGKVREHVQANAGLSSGPEFPPLPNKPARFIFSIRQLWRRFGTRQLIGDIPDDIALCEFDCHRGHCSYGEWASCARRISNAAGELMPDRPKVISSETPDLARRKICEGSTPES